MMFERAIEYQRIGPQPNSFLPLAGGAHSKRGDDGDHGMSQGCHNANPHTGKRGILIAAAAAARGPKDARISGGTDA